MTRSAAVLIALAALAAALPSTASAASIEVRPGRLVVSVPSEISGRTSAAVVRALDGGGAIVALYRTAAPAAGNGCEQVSATTIGVPAEAAGLGTPFVATCDL